MYPGPPGAKENHRHGYCADGVKQVPSHQGEELLPWPQPKGIFMNGQLFHPRTFLTMVPKLFEHMMAIQLSMDTCILELEAFTKMLQERATKLDEDNNTVLFKLYKGLKIDPSWPKGSLRVHDGDEWLPIDYLSCID
jgi:hypothetical protein